MPQTSLTKPVFIDLPRFTAAAGRLRLPGSKSISNRVLLLAALAEGKSEIHGLLHSDDTAVMISALKTLGVEFVEDAQSEVLQVTGIGGAQHNDGFFPVKNADLFLGNAGTAIRSLTAALAFAGGNYTLSGVARMHERPIGDLVDALRQVGAQIDYLGQEGFPPLAIGRASPLNTTHSLNPITPTTPTTLKVRGDVSSQFLSGLLMALPLLSLSGAENRLEVVGELISKPYVEITLAIMAQFGVKVLRDGEQAFVLPAHSAYRSPGLVHVEGDASSASYFLALGALAASSASPLRVEGVGSASIQGDVHFAKALTQMGAHIEIGENWIEASVPATKLKGIQLDCNHIPDAAMTLAVLALFAEGSTTLSNIASWRVKETDRIAAMAHELSKLGAHIETGHDFLRITPCATADAMDAPAAGIDTYDDHRVAMCFSLASYAMPLRINDPACVAKTFPDYFAQWAKLVKTVPVIAIDGPSASGKGTIATRVAAALGWHYLDSGALYRLAALAAMRAGVAWSDEAGVAALAAKLDVVFAGESIKLAGVEVSAAIRSEAISDGASKVAALPAVRAALLLRQREFRQSPGLVADGRDMGSVVFPDAQTKIFLTASPEIRAQRRLKQLIEQGIAANIAPILQDLQARDARDCERSLAPLQQTKQAKRLDTAQLSIEKSVEQVIAWYHDSR